MDYKLRIFSLLIASLFIACQPVNQKTEKAQPQETMQEEPPGKAQRIVDRAIEAHGGDLIDDRRIEFDFRGRRYVSTREDGQFTYERIFTDTTGDRIRDVLTNEMFYRQLNGERVDLPAKDSAAYANSVNSVIYFALLPYYLNDPSAIKEYLGEESVQGKPYHKVKVTFRQEGGGKDFQDEFIYWFQRDNYTMDYLAYNYETEGGGARFREAYNVRTVDGIRFADYINYKPTEKTMDVASFAQRFEEGELEELSRIDIENVQVEKVALQ